MDRNKDLSDFENLVHGIQRESNQRQHGDTQVKQPHKHCPILLFYMM